jgi:hypothetical protein
MIESLCLAGMLFGNLWGPVMSDAGKTPVTGPAAAVPPCDQPVPLTPPVKPVARPSCDEPPDLQKILRALPCMPRGLPYIYDVFRDDVEVSAEKLVDSVDPPCFFPLIGLAQLHHCHWKCTVTFTEHIDVGFPCPFQIKRRRSEVVYIDKDHLRHCMAANSDDGRNANSGSCPGGRFAGKEIGKDSAKSPSDKRQLVSPPAGARYDRTGYPKQAFEKMHGEVTVVPISPLAVQPCPPARDQRNAPMSLSDVVRMSQKSISQQIILRQMELTNAVFNLTVDDIIELHDHGVAEQIIRAMQERRDPSTLKLQTDPGAASRPPRSGVIYSSPPPGPVFVEPRVDYGIRGRY